MKMASKCFVTLIVLMGSRFAEANEITFYETFAKFFDMNLESFVPSVSNDFDAEPRVHMEPDLLNTFDVNSTYNSQWRAVDQNERAEIELNLQSSSRKMIVYFMLKHSNKNFAKLEKKLYQVSDPRSESYGKHLSLDDIKELAPIPQKYVETAMNFLKNYGISGEVNHNSDIIEAHVDVKVAEKMFNTNIMLFVNKIYPGMYLYRAYGPYSLPKSVADCVHVIGDLVLLPYIRHDPKISINKEKSIFGRGAWENDCDLPSCTGLVTPGVLKKRYHISEKNPVKGNSMAVAEFQGQYFDHRDIGKFSSACHVNVTVEKETGGDEEKAGMESLLDIEYIKAVAPEIPLNVVYSGQYSLLAWVRGISNQPKPDWVHSVSYGNDENQQISSAYVFAVNVQLMKAGTRGLSILFASGDQGVCGREGCGFIMRRYRPDFPAASPYVTAVGGTDFSTNDIGEEKVWSCTGGGFSNHFPIPEFQKQAVENYKKSASLPRAHLWNATGRGYPDISALGGTKTPYCVVVHGLGVGIAGTSASCPVAAGIFAKLNGIRLSKGKSPLGWLNPFIYQHADAFQDVTIGSNGCSPFVKGFEAISGWDPSSGVGTPDFDKLASIVAALS